MGIKRSPINWKTVALDYLIKRDHLICGLCHKPIDENILSVDIDHIIPVASGGLDELDNLRIVHHACHRLRKRLEQAIGDDVQSFFTRNGFVSKGCKGFKRVPFADLTHIEHMPDLVAKVRAVGEVKLLSILSDTHNENNLSLSEACRLLDVSLDRVRYFASKNHFPSNIKKWPLIDPAFFKRMCEKHIL